VTAGKAKLQATNRDAVSAMQAYITSLLYLRQEARRDGLEVVADIMWNALAAIEKWLDSGQAPVGSGAILDLPLCHSLEFLFTWTALPRDKQKQVVREITRYETSQEVNRAGPRPRRRISKAIAS
jgi:hypothetical protein